MDFPELSLFLTQHISNIVDGYAMGSINALSLSCAGNQS
ncbi:hypothetical protein L293_0538 [Acinetobacter gyllenbergii CIP 110306 = MTCC 11365]|nr:hypothetical protein L293_0538 [Acinetobacter gyllenbergii CIP 110306 = MTCC 11365]